MKKIYFILMFTILMLGVSIDVYASDEPLEFKYNEIVNNFVKENEDTTAGVSITIFDKNNTILKENYGYADIENKIKVDTNTVFEWGSISKTLIWVSAMQLYEDGKLDLNEDIRKYLPDNFLKLKYDEKITMLNLMNHEAGFQETFIDLYVTNIKDVKPLEDVLKGSQPMQIYKPGTVTAYSNYSSSLASLVIEKVSGKPYYQYVKENIFNILGMYQTSVNFDLSDNIWVQENIKKTKCYTTENNLIENCYLYISMYPSGAVAGTINDLEIFVKSLIDENSLLFDKVETYKLMLSPSKYYGNSNVPSNYHGLWVNDLKVQTIGHGGNTAGHSAQFMIDLNSGLTTIVMTNQKYETNYNYLLFEKIYGSWEESILNDTSRVFPNKYYRDSRTISEGPLSISKYLTNYGKLTNEDIGSYWSTKNINNKINIAVGNSDLLEISAFEYYLNNYLPLLLIIGVIYSLITLIIGYLVINIILKKKKDLKFRKWNYLSNLYIGLFGSSILTLFICINSFGITSKSYLWIFYLIFLLAILFIKQIVVFFLKYKELQNYSKREKIKYFITLLFIIVSLLNVIYFEMYQFWNI